MLFALATGLAGVISKTQTIVTAGVGEIADGSIGMGLGGGGWLLWHSLSGPSKPTAVVTTQTVGPYKIKVLGEGTHLRLGDNAIRIEVTDATAKPADVGSVWLELRMDMPGMAMQATAQLEKGQSPGVFNGSIRPTGQGEWHASIGCENQQGKNATSFTLSIAP